MKELVISKIEEGQRFDKYLAKCLPNASKGFLYKMLRKKNITLNSKKADGSEKIKSGDVVKVFFSDETFESMAGRSLSDKNIEAKPKSKVIKIFDNLKIEFENDHILIVNKPSGILSQKANKEDVSIIEYITEYINKENDNVLSAGYKPGICNRLDRNTSGLIVAGKTITGLQHMTEKFRTRDMAKYYICLVAGLVKNRKYLKGYLYKDERTNKVTIYKENDSNIPEDAVFIETEFIPVIAGEKASLLKVHLITGRTHQIRAHLAYSGHAIIGDLKYGISSVNDYYRKKYGIKNQMLHAFELNIPKDDTIDINEDLRVTTKIPNEFINCLKGEKLWEPGIPEALEDLH